MVGKFGRLLIVSMIFNTLLSAANDLSPKYIRLFTDENGNGIWQMVGVAGFYNNIYGVEYQEDGNGSVEYTSFYCEEQKTGSIIRTRDRINDPFNDMNGTYWLFSIKITEDIKELSPLVVDVASSDIDCAGVSLYSSNANTAAPTEAFIYADENATSSFVKFAHPSNVNPSVVFSLDYNSSKIYRINLDSVPQQKLTLNTDLLPITDENITNNMSIATQPIDEIVDLYLNDNPGFGSAEDNSTNYNRDSREYHSANHQVPIDEDNYLSRNSELKIFSFDNSQNRWLEYNSKNKIINTNDFTELQAGRGYWIKYDFSGIDANTFLQTLDLNKSCGVGCESNLTIKSASGNDRNYSFVNSDVVSIVNGLNDTNISNGEVNVSAIKIADNSVLLIFKATGKPTLGETTSDYDVFLNINSATTTYSPTVKTQEIKPGLVLGDSSVVLTSNSVYSSIAQKGWNLLTLPTSTIRKSITGLIVDWNTSNGYTNFTISDEFGVNKVVLDSSLASENTTDKNASTSAKIINGVISRAQLSGELSSQFFNVRAMPLGANNDKILFVSNDRFNLSTTATFGDAKNLTLKTTDLKNKDIVSSDKKKISANYGEYALLFQPNLESQFIKDGNGKIEINGVSISVPTSIENLVTNINDNNSSTGVYAFAIDSDFNGSINNDGSDYILLTSSKTISLKDTTYTKIYKFDINREGTSYISIYDGTDTIDGRLKTIAIPKDKNISASGKAGEFNDTYTYTDTGRTVKYNSYILDENGSTTIDGNESEYIVISSTDSSSIILVEDVVDRNITEDSLSSIFGYDKNISTQGAILKGIQVNDLATFDINSSGCIDVTNSTISNITANPFITDDLIASNSLITLSKAFSGDRRYMPTMIIGSESDVNTGRIYWKALSPVQKVSRWYYEYNLFSTNNQRAYWVYLDDYPQENPIQILSGEGVATDELPSVTKKYIRTFDNENNITHNYFNLTNIRANVKGVLQDANGNADANSVYVVANLVGVSPQVDKLDFKMPMASSSTSVAPLVDNTMEFSTSINYFDVDGLNNNLSSIKITATDGRLYTDEYTLQVDVKKPSKPTVSFSANSLAPAESTKIYIKSGDLGTTGDDTVKYLIFKERIDDINGTVFSENVNVPSNFLLSVGRDIGEVGVEDLCRSSKFAGDNIGYVPLVIVALDNNDTSQANFSDMTKINFVPMQNVHVLVADANVSGNQQDLYPNVYNAQCEATGELKDDNGNPIDSGVDLISYNGAITLTYKPFDVTTGTTLQNSIFVATPNGTLLANVKYDKRYEGKNFLLYKDGSIYQGVFLTEAQSQDYDNSSNLYRLKKVSSSGQKIGE